MTLAVNEKITIYDAFFIIAAKELKTELVTSDKKQVEVAVRNGVKAIFYIDCVIPNPRKRDSSKIVLCSYNGFPD